MRVLTDQDQFACPHGGRVLVLTAVSFKIEGHPALVAFAATGPSTRIEGCPADPPCTGSEFDATSSPLQEGGFHIVLDTSPTAAYRDDGSKAGALVLTPGEGGGFGGGITLVE